MTDREQDIIAQRLGISSQAHKARHGAHLGEPSARERFAEIVGRPPLNRWEITTFRSMASRLGDDPSLAEMQGLWHRLGRKLLREVFTWQQEATP